MKSTCPHCTTTFRLDPRKVPAAGVRARCSVCSGIFQVRPAAVAQEPASQHSPPQFQPQAAVTAEAPAPAPAPVVAPEPVAGPAESPREVGGGFGATDPHSKARRLARALVSDISVYHPERLERSLREGTLRQEFREEIRKSWEEYVAQVGEQTARSTPYFREALNDILARGAAIF